MVLKNFSCNMIGVLRLYLTTRFSLTLSITANVCRKMFLKVKKGDFFLRTVCHFKEFLYVHQNNILSLYTELFFAVIVNMPCIQL